MKELSVYKQMTMSPNECLSAIKREIGLKITCVPFAVKVMDALKTLKIKTDDDAIKAANTLLSGLQTLWQGGIVAEDYDKLDFVNRGNTIVPSARVEAFLRAAARKGYRITDTIIAVPQEDSDTTYFKENFYNGEIVYTLEDRRINSDRAVTAQRLIDGYFDRFLCRLEVRNATTNQRVAMTVCEMSAADMLEVSSVSEQGIYKSRWEEYTTGYGYKKKRKVITNEINSGSFWVKWTGEMVNKTIIRRALKRIKEVLPELKESIYAFESDDNITVEATEATPIPEPDIEIPVIAENVNLHKLTPEQKEEYREMIEIFKANPKLADDKMNEITKMFEDGADKQTVINAEYASIRALMDFKSKRERLKEYLK